MIQFCSECNCQALVYSSVTLFQVKCLFLSYTLLAPGDYTGAVSMVLTFSAGSMSVTASVPTVDDNVLETDERFNGILRFPSPNGRVTLGARSQAEGLILNDDSK